MEKKLLFIFFINFLLIYIFYNLFNIDNKFNLYFLKRNSNYINQNIENTEVNLNLNSSLLFSPFKPAISQNISLLSPVNAPLSPFKAPFLSVNLGDEILPQFLLYKTNILLSPPEQGICGSCWAFSICNLLGDKVAIYSGGLIRKPLSVQQLISCYEPENACYGNSPENALIWLEKNQYNLREDDEIMYRQMTDNIVSSNCPADIHGVYVVKGTVKRLTNFIEEKDPNKTTLKKNIENMKSELYKSGPLYSAITIYEDFYTYSGDTIYSHSEESPKIGGHCIEIIGYCDANIDTRQGMNEPYWICKNSWGSHWPTKATEFGYFAIKMGINECGIESRCGTAEPMSNQLKKIKNKNIKSTRYEDFEIFRLQNKFGFFT